MFLVGTSDFFFKSGESDLLQNSEENFKNSEEINIYFSKYRITYPAPVYKD